MEKMETAQRLVGCSFGVNGVPFWGKLKAPFKHHFRVYSLGLQNRNQMQDALEASLVQAP